MIVLPRILSVLTTRRCTAACDHCCVGASPKAAAAIPVERIHRLIDEAKRIPTFERIVFSGGECFLLGERLDELVAHAHGLGFNTRVVSNGFWAGSPAAAARRMTALRRAGLDEMMLSTGTFHQRYVALERIVNAARAASAARIATLISVEECDQSTCDGGSIAAQLEDEIASGWVSIKHDPWIPDAGGRGEAVLSHERLVAKRPQVASARCEQVLTILTVTPDQILTACCGFPTEQLPALRIGSVADRALDDVIRAAPTDLLAMWLHVAGPAGIAEFVGRHVPGYKLPAFASICQGCVALQRDTVAMRTVAAHAGEVAQTIALEFVRMQSGGLPEPVLSI